MEIWTKISGFDERNSDIPGVGEYGKRRKNGRKTSVLKFHFARNRQKDRPVFPLRVDGGCEHDYGSTEGVSRNSWRKCALLTILTFPDFIAPRFPNFLWLLCWLVKLLVVPSARLAPPSQSQSPAKVIKMTHGFSQKKGSIMIRGNCLTSWLSILVLFDPFSTCKLNINFPSSSNFALFFWVVYGVPLCEHRAPQAANLTNFYKFNFFQWQFRRKILNFDNFQRGKCGFRFICSEHIFM